MLKGKKFDAFTLIIYAVWWIRQSIQQAVNERAK